MPVWSEEEERVLNQESTTIDFENPNTFIDISDALNSRQYVHRAILNNAITHTSQFAFSRFYINHLMGYSAVWQRIRPVVKYVTGVQGVSVGYVGESGHSVEMGLDLSAISNVNMGYKLVLKTQSFFSVWPYFGLGAGKEVGLLRLAKGPPESESYRGSDFMGYGLFGLLIPLVDVGLRAELRVYLFSMDRVVLTQGIGAVIFL